ncbi:MAG: hypothetical protein ACM3ZB_09610 [bacterium]
MRSDQKRELFFSIAARLRAGLDVGLEDVATIAGATGEALREWENGTAEIPEPVLGRMIAAGKSLDQLLGIFRPERLPQVIRRRADAFDGERALDWILDGRIAEVADRYDEGLSYLKRPA